VKREKKIHFYDINTLIKAPKFIVDEYKKLGEDGGICGYVGKVTKNKNKVTCKRCLSILWD
jgi:hypothetical protein